ncbi:MAG: response regulator [Caulobacter sp.]|nr:response regulator [Vitreoscilla sp.]
MRALIVDDEYLARHLIREYLQGHADIEIVGECDNGLDAVRQIGALAPDLVFLDIQMPRLTGLEVLELTGRRAGVIFTTAYDEHAIKAFELHAVDYLLKPFSRARFDDALARARTLHAPTLETLETPAPAAAPALDALVARRTAPLERILIRDREQVHVIPVDQVECIEAQGDYLAIHAAGKCHLKPQRISEIEEQLDATCFLRVHRSFIISLAHLQAIERPGPDRHAARLRSGKRVPISRSGYEKLRELV